MQNIFRSGIPTDFSSSDQRARDAALLRATTDLFVQELANDRDQTRRYEELATHFLPRVAAKDRAYVAERLSVRLDAPQSVIRMLAKDEIDIARHVLRQSPVLGPLDLLTVIASRDHEHHRLIAQRPGLGTDVAHALRLAGDKETLEILDVAAGAAATKTASTAADDSQDATPPIAVAPETNPAPSAPKIAEPHTATDPTPNRLDVWRFLGLARPERLRLMASLATRPPARDYSGPANRLDRVFRSILGAAQIAGLARAGKRQDLVEAIADGLDINKDIVLACLDDATGEPAAVLLKALGLDNVQAQQVFLLATPTVGLDVNVFFRLTDIYAGMENWVAEILVDAWRNKAPAQTPRHEPHFAENGNRRRPIALPEQNQDRRQPPAERATGT